MAGVIALSFARWMPAPCGTYLAEEILESIFKDLLASVDELPA
jgi:hypothetical protein